ncbi:S4 domain-containing protein, partial [Kingella denitrificans]
MSKKQPQSKREFRDGISKKRPAKSAKPVSKTTKSSLHFAKRGEAEQPQEHRSQRGQRGAARHEQSPKEYAAPVKQRAAKARKLVVRAPNQKIQQHVQELKEKRTDLSRIEPERLQKVLAASGVGSRREMEEWINNGWVQVNGRVAVLGEKITPEDQVTVKGSAIKLKWADRLPRIILYYK